MRKIYKLLIVLILSLILFSLSFLVVSSYFTRNLIVVGTKNFTEQNIIGYLIKEVIEDNTEYQVRVLPGIGETSFLQTSILRGDIDMYVDYTSTAYINVLGHEYVNQSESEITNTVKNEYDKLYDLDWVSFLGFDNSNAIICGNYCEENNIETISDLAKKHDFTFGAPNFFYERSDGFVLMEEKYGMSIPDRNKVQLDSSLIYPSVSAGEVDVALGYTTDGRLYGDDYTILQDDLHVYPKYDAGIIVSEKFESEFQSISKLLKKLNNSISQQDMQKLNYQVDIQGKTSEQVAHDYYEKNIKKNL